MPKVFNWDDGKNRQLITERGVSFEDVVFCIEQGRLLDDLAHPNRDRYPHQRLLVVEIDGYAWLVPYVENGDEIFLETVIPSRKATRKYLGDKT
ncbi:MAG TPA: BrnT family toxin [Chromatiales bacterium]|nr:BrnT family toxin [Chromatiales bacterium]